MRLRPAWVAALALGACSDDPLVNGQADAFVADADAADTVLIDVTESDVDTATSCAEQLVADVTFELDPNERTTQIHIGAAFDGQSVWTVHNSRGANDDFDVWLTRVDCDGTAEEVAQVDSNDGPGAIEPQIAVNRHGLLVAYQTDTPGGDFNLDLVARSFQPDGRPFDPEERVLELTRAGVANPGNAWMPALTATRDAFAIVGAWGHDDAPAFQAVYQSLTAYGVPTGDATDVALEPAVGQIYPAVASTEDAATVAWVAQRTDLPDAVQFARITADGPSATVTLEQEPAGPPSVAMMGETTVIATSAPDASGGADVLLVVVDADGNLSAPATVGEPGEVEHTPSVVLADEDTGAVLYYRTLRGFQNELWLAPFDVVGGAIAFGSPTRISTTDPVAPYTPAIRYVGDGAYFIAWSEGQSPDFRAYFRFVAP